MEERRSKTEQLCDEIRLRLQNGRYAPGERIDPVALAREFGISLTPVRSALDCLAGEGLIDNRPRDGSYAPLITERELRELYDWMERLLHWACDILSASSDEASVQLALSDRDEGNDLVAQTRLLFQRIAFETGHDLLQQLMHKVNRRLGPVRHAEQGFVEDAFDELAGLHLRWETRDLATLKAALTTYHDRRRRLVPRIIARVARAAAYARR